ncbi:hypothetical protein PIIN_10785 [Serendipita indica DSM 11827]|uniref:Uncharacterized protein n=1 Tax=Serendipita indica (strain DSM 11827) TaxID=1109443 RepID=G4TZQ6_SERID|nr:hypothetical protein PIIN_10785 [Serendipita indica DSM 11827]
MTRRSWTDGTGLSVVGLSSIGYEHYSGLQNCSNVGHRWLVGPITQ